MHPDPERPPLDRWMERVFGDGDEKHAGLGWRSGITSLFLGTLSLLAVIGFHFPGALSSSALRAHYSVPVLRALLDLAIVATFVTGAVSLVRRRRKVLGASGLALAVAATLGGAGHVPIESDLDQRFSLGLDWFVLELLVLALLFVPLERAFPKHPAQGTFRFGWTTDVTHFMVSHLGVQALAFATLLPATALAALWQPEALRRTVGEQPIPLQLVEIVVIADLTQYAVHRAFHRVPWLWRFHAIHHSSRAVDWLAGSRLHFVDVIATRGAVLVPIVALGFAEPALYGYLVLVSVHAVFLHANLRFRTGWLDQLIATPRVHHWHHAMAPPDRNFAVHLPVIDRIFGTQQLPPDDAWPEAYGIPGHPVPEGWWSQLAAPFRRRR